MHIRPVAVPQDGNKNVTVKVLLPPRLMKNL